MHIDRLSNSNQCPDWDLPENHWKKTNAFPRPYATSYESYTMIYKQSWFTALRHLVYQPISNADAQISR